MQKIKIIITAEIPDWMDPQDILDVVSASLDYAGMPEEYKVDAEIEEEL